jgi:hypothetical protein
MFKNPLRWVLPLTAAVVACSSIAEAPAPAGSAIPASVTVATGYRLSVFAGAPDNAARSSKPDSIVQLGRSVFIGYGDTLNGDGTIVGSNPSVQGKTEIIQYDLNGRFEKVFSVTGHNDGLMAYDAHTLWVMCNEDDNPILTVIDLGTGKQTEYVPSKPLPHGGLDDMVLIKGVVFATASHHSVLPTGKVSGAPAVVALSLNTERHTFDWAPVLASNAQVTHAVTGAPLTLNLTQPDSAEVDPGGALVVDGVADAQLVFVQNPGMPNQSARLLPVTLYRNRWALDDTRFVPAAKNTFMLFADTSTNTVYRIDAPFAAGDAYSAGHGTVLKLDTSSGALTPIVVGLAEPHGMWFVTP